MKNAIKHVFSLLCILFMVTTFSSCDSGVLQFVIAMIN